jgi:hypothetical protein
MLRHLTVVTSLLACLTVPAWSQSPSTTAAPAAPSSGTPVAKKSAPKAKAAAKPVATTDSGLCKYGVIVAVGDVFAVQKIGLTVFGNEYAEVPVSWGLDDLIFTRTRAAAGGIPLRRIPYAKGAFDSYYHPKPSLFRNERQELTEIVRQTAGSSGCERYYVFTRLKGQFPGTNQFIEGVGIVNRGVGILNSSFLFANVSLAVFDGDTFEIRKAPSTNFEAVLSALAAGLTSDPGLRKMDDTAFPATPEEAAKSATLRDGARNFLTEHLDKFLPTYFKE